MDLLKTFTNDDFKGKNLWVWTGGEYTVEGYYIPICIDIVKNTKMALDLSVKKKNTFINSYRWFPS